MSQSEGAAFDVSQSKSGAVPVRSKYDSGQSKVQKKLQPRVEVSVRLRSFQRKVSVDGSRSKRKSVERPRVDALKHQVQSKKETKNK